jgi:HEAT repeat protein
MRLLLPAAAAALLLATTGLAQEAKKDKEKEKVPPERKDSLMKLPEINEIGGKTLEQWVKEMSARDPSKRDNAVRTVVMFGAERAYPLAMPVLLAELRKHSPSAPIDLSVRLSGCNALGAFLSSVKEPDPRHLREAVLILRKLCKDEQAMVRVRAAQALAAMGPNARSALAEVIGVAQDRDTWEARQAGVQAVAVLCALDPPPPAAALSAIYRALNDSSMQVRLAGVQALAMLGPLSDPTTQGNMIRHLDTLASKDSEPSLQIWGHMGMMTIKRAAPTEHLAPIIKMLHHPDVGTRIQAAQALATVGPKANSAIPTLISSLSDPDPSVVGNSIIALARIEATGAVPALRRVAADKNSNEAVKLAANEAVEHLTKKKNDDTK